MDGEWLIVDPPRCDGCGKPTHFENPRLCLECFEGGKVKVEEAIKQVNFHLDRAQEAADKLPTGPVAARVRKNILLVRLDMTNC